MNAKTTMGRKCDPKQDNTAPLPQRLALLMAIGRQVCYLTPEERARAERCRTTVDH
jgi:hypothetical protein